MPVSATDSLLFKNLFGTKRIRDVFGDRHCVWQCFRVERALSRAQAKIGVIPEAAFETMAEAYVPLMVAYMECSDEQFSEETESVSYPISTFVKNLTEVCGEEAGKFVHWGATTQDIQDTAFVLQMQEGLEMVEKLLHQLIRTLSTLCERYRNAEMAGQDTLPVTFGYKCAVYLSSVRRHIERLDQLRLRCLLVQFNGGAGTLASLGSDTDVGLKVRAAMAEEFDLQSPSITWQSARDGIAEIVNFLALIGGTLARIATDLVLMSSNEFSEVSEPFVPHRGASSTMPQKRNLISSELIIAASRVLRSNAGLCLDAMITDFERAAGSWHPEGVVVPESFVIAVGALSQADFALSALAIDTDSIQRNSDCTRGLIVAEAVMMELAVHVGRQEAHDIIYEACKETIEGGESPTLFDTLLAKPSVSCAIATDRLRELCEPGS